MSRGPPQRRKAQARNGVAHQNTGCFIAGVVNALATASCMVLRHGMETRCPGGAGQRQPAGSVRSMTAWFPQGSRQVSAKPHGRFTE